jgi:hypothetical protein
MVHGRIRSAKACERCRVAKRRCRPPYPCRPCISHGEQCVVRDKARYGMHEKDIWTYADIKRPGLAGCQEMQVFRPNVQAPFQSLVLELYPSHIPSLVTMRGTDQIFIKRWGSQACRLEIRLTSSSVSSELYLRRDTVRTSLR